MVIKLTCIDLNNFDGKPPQLRCKKEKARDRLIIQ